MPRDNDPSLEEVKFQLALRAEEFGRHLAAIAGWGEPASQNNDEIRWPEKDGSKSGKSGGRALVTSGRKRGLYCNHYGGGKGGTLLDAAMEALGCDIATAIQYAKRWLGFDGDQTPAQPTEAVLRERERKQAESEAQEQRSQNERIAKARRLDAESVPVRGTVAERYLAETRLIPVPESGWPVPVRFHAKSKSLLVTATLATGEVRAVQRVYLDGDARKIGDEERARRKLPAVKHTNGVRDGAAVRLPGPSDGPLLLVEGPETGLSVWTTGYETWIALGGIGGLYPPIDRIIVVCIDDDEEGSSSDTALSRTVAEWRAAGHRLVVATPHAKRRFEGDDFNDVLRESGPEGVRARIEAALAPPPPPPPPGLPAYYPAPTETIETAIPRQIAIIEKAIREGSARAVQRQRIQARRAELLAGILDPSDTDKAAATRRASKEINGGPLPKPSRILITGSQGSGKTSTAISKVSELRDPVVAWIVEPTLAKAIEVAGDYRRIAQPESLPVRVVYGRGAPDPERDGETMCERPKAASAVSQAGLSVRKSLCPGCPANARCGYMRQDRHIEAMDGRGLFVLATPYLFLPSPAPVADVLVVDEDAVMPAVEVIEIPLSDLDPLGIDGIGIDARDTLNTLRAILMRETRQLEAIRAAQVDKSELKLVIGALRRRLEEITPKIDGAMSDEEVIFAVDQPERSRIGGALAILAAIRREIDVPRAIFNAITSDGDKVTISRLRKPRGIKKSAILALDGTGDPELARHIYGDRLQHEEIRVERKAFVTGTRGKSYSRQSITGVNRKGNPLPDREASSAKLRDEIKTIASRLPGTPVVVASKRVIQALDLPDDAPRAHFGALRGLNTWESYVSEIVVGRESISVENAETLGRAFIARDREALLPLKPDPDSKGWPCRATRMRRMRDGSLSPVEIELHPDLRIQRVLEQVREAELMQGIDRPRPLWNPRTYAVLNDLCMDLTYDRIVTHREIVLGGNPIERAYLATGILPLGARDLHKLNPTLFPTLRVADRALNKYPPSPNKSTIWRRGVFVRFRLTGQRGRPSRALVDLTRHPAPYAALLSALGPLVAWGDSEPEPRPTNPERAPACATAPELPGAPTKLAARLCLPEPEPEPDWSDDPFAMALDDEDERDWEDDSWWLYEPSDSVEPPAWWVALHDSAPPPTGPP